MKTLTTEEWELLKEAMLLVMPKGELRDFEMRKIKSARILLGSSHDRQEYLTR